MNVSWIQSKQLSSETEEGGIWIAVHTLVARNRVVGPCLNFSYLYFPWLWPFFFPSFFLFYLNLLFLVIYIITFCYLFNVTFFFLGILQSFSFRLKFVMEALIIFLLKLWLSVFLDFCFRLQYSCLFSVFIST